MLWRLMGYIQEEKGGQGTTCLCTMGDIVEDGGEGKIRYDGGSKKCSLAREGIGVRS